MRRTSLERAVRRVLEDLVFPGETIVVGLSGGPDSVALLDAVASLASEFGFKVVAAHLDHSLREDSAADAAFCRELSSRLGVPFRAGSANVRNRARLEKGGLEEAARVERYLFLQGVAKECGGRLVAVAHTRDDQAETLLLRLLRGAGSLGLASMRPVSGAIVRPLLNVSREEVLAHLEARGLPSREDPSNADLSLLRNRVRRELIPYLESRFNPTVRAALARTARLLSDEAEVLERSGRALLDEVGREDGGGITLTRSGLKDAPPALARLAIRGALSGCGGLRGVACRHVEAVLELACAPAPSGRRLPLPGGREALFRFGSVWIGPRRASQGPFALPLSVPGRVALPGGITLLARSDSGPAVSKPEGAVVPLVPGLTVRTRRPGDRVRVGGRERSLKRFFMERRVPADLRGDLPLVASGHEVLFVPGEILDVSKREGGGFVRLELRAT
jgi:tRNA(Ile)-lysidine synthase